MSAHIDINSETTSKQAEEVSQRRVTIFERPEIVDGLSANVIAAIQREMVEIRAEMEEKIQEKEFSAMKRFVDLIKLSSLERIQIEKIRNKIPAPTPAAEWETGTENSESRSVS